LRPGGPTWLPRLGDEQFTVPKTEPAKGATAHGRADQKWTLRAITTVIAGRFPKTYTLQGRAKPLKGGGWSCQVPARRAPEHEEQAVQGRSKQTWPHAK
jgi:Winged helix-turn helix